MLHACERFELHILSSFNEIKTNSLLPRITDQQLRHFRHQWGVRKVGKRFPAATLDRNNSRTAWLISAIHVSLFSKFKAFLYESKLCYPCSSPLSNKARSRGGGDQSALKHSRSTFLYSAMRELVCSGQLWARGAQKQLRSYKVG